MGVTPDLNLRFPELTDDPNGPAQIKNLADDVEAVFAGGQPVSGTLGEVWRLDYAAVTINPADLPANTGQSLTVTIAGLVVGDLCFFLGADTTNNSQIWRCRPPVCQVAGQITLGQFNPDTVSVDIPSSSFSFLVIHRS